MHVLCTIYKLHNYKHKHLVRLLRECITMAGKPECVPMYKCKTHKSGGRKRHLNTEAWCSLLEMTVGTQVNIDIFCGTNSGIQLGFKSKTFWILVRCLATTDTITLWNYKFSFFLPKVLKCIIDSQATIFACKVGCAFYNTGGLVASWNLAVWCHVWDYSCSKHWNYLLQVVFNIFRMHKRSSCWQLYKSKVGLKIKLAWPVSWLISSSSLHPTPFLPPDHAHAPL